MSARPARHERSLSRIRSRRGKRTGDPRTARRRRPRAQGHLPVSQRAGPQRRSLQWDILRLWQKIGAASTTSPTSRSRASASTPGAATTRSSASTATCSRTRITTAIRAPTASWKRLASVSAERIYAITGIQFLNFNTLFQLYAACSADAAAHRRRARVRHDSRSAQLLAHRPSSRAEYTIATTTQIVDARTRTWATGLLVGLDPADALLPRLVEPGTVVGAGSARRLRLAGRHARGRAGLSRHRIGLRGGLRRRPQARSSARARGRCSARRCRAGRSRARARELNFTNEGGVCGTTRLLKNIGGLWLLQACRRPLGRSRPAGFSYDDLLAAARDDGTRSGRSSIRTTAGSSTARHAVGHRRLLPADGSAGAGRAAGVRARDSREPRVQVPRRPRVARGADRHAATRRSGSSAADRATGCSISSPRTRPAAPCSPGRSKRPRSATSRCRCSRPARWARSPRRERSSNGRSRSSDSIRSRPIAGTQHYARFQEYVEVMCV